MSRRKWHGAALPAAAEHAGDRVAKPDVGVGDTHLHAAQAAGLQAEQELRPEGLGLGLADVQADHLAHAGVVHRIGDHERLLAHAARLPDALDLGVEPQIRIASFQRALAENLHLLIQSAAHARDLVLGQTSQAHLLDQAVDLARAHTVDVCLLHDRHERLLGAPAWLQKARQVAAAAKPWDRELDLAHARVPAPVPIAIALGKSSVGHALAELGAHELRDLGLHDLPDHHRHRLAQHICVLERDHLARRLAGGHAFPFGHRGVSFVELREQNDDHERRGGRMLLQPAAELHHNYRLNLSSDEGSNPTHPSL